MSHDPELEARCRKVLADWDRRQAAWRPTGPNDPAMLLVELLCSQVLELERRLERPRTKEAADLARTLEPESQLIALRSQAQEPIELPRDHWFSGPQSQDGTRLLDSIAVQPIESANLRTCTLELQDESGCFREIELAAAKAASRVMNFALPKSPEDLRFELRARSEVLDTLLLAEYWYCDEQGQRLALTRAERVGLRLAQITDRPPQGSRRLVLRLEGAATGVADEDLPELRFRTRFQAKPRLRMEARDGLLEVALPDLELAQLELNFASTWFRGFGTRSTIQWQLCSSTHPIEAVETPLYKPERDDSASRAKAWFDSQSRLAGLRWKPSPELWRPPAAAQRSSASTSIQAKFQVSEPHLSAALIEQEPTSWQLDLRGPWQRPEVSSRDGGLMALELDLKLRDGARLSELSVFVSCESLRSRGRLFVDGKIGSQWMALSVQDGTLGLTQPGPVKIDLRSFPLAKERELVLRLRVDPESAKRRRKIHWLVLNGARARSDLILRDVALGYGDGLPDQSFEVQKPTLSGTCVDLERSRLSGIESLRVDGQLAAENAKLEPKSARVILNAPLPIGAELRCDLIFEPARQRSIRAGTNLQSESGELQARVLAQISDRSRRFSYDEALSSTPPIGNEHELSLRLQEIAPGFEQSVVKLREDGRWVLEFSLRARHEGASGELCAEALEAALQERCVLGLRLRHRPCVAAPYVLRVESRRGALEHQRERALELINRGASLGQPARMSEIVPRIAPLFSGFNPLTCSLHGPGAGESLPPFAYPVCLGFEHSALGEDFA